MEIEHLLTDNGRETCGKPLSHPYELFLAVSRIEHRKTKVGSPETNGFCERFHRTVKEEFYAVAFRKKFYESLDELQRDLDAYLVFYNRERAHQGLPDPGAHAVPGVPRWHRNDARNGGDAGSRLGENLPATGALCVRSKSAKYSSRWPKWVFTMVRNQQIEPKSEQPVDLFSTKSG